MKLKIKFTVIVSVNKNSNFLKECLNSLIDQYYPYEEYEVILASPIDATEQIEEIKYVYTPFKLQNTAKNKNSAEAKNSAIGLSKGEIILFIDADVVCATDLLSMHEKAHKLSKNNKTIILGSYNFSEELLHKPLINYLQNNKNSLYNLKYPAYKYQNFQYFNTKNISIQRIALINNNSLNTNFFESGYSEYYENIVIAYQLEELGYSLFSYPDAITINMKEYDVSTLLKERKKKGIDSIKFLHSNQSMIKKSRELTGFDFQDSNISKRIKQSFLSNDNFTNIISTLDKISKIKIDNTSFIPTGQGRNISNDKLNGILDKYINLLSTQFYRKGLEEGIQKYGMPKINRWEINEKNRLNKNSRKKLRMLICSENITNDISLQKIIFDGIENLSSKNIAIAIFSLSDNKIDSNIPFFLERSNKENLKYFTVYNHNKPYTLENEPEREIEDRHIKEIYENILDEFKPDIVRYDTFRPFSFAIAEATHKRKIPSIYFPQDFHIIDPKLMLMRTTTESWVNFDIFANTPLRDIYPKKERVYIERREKSIEIMNKFIDFTICRSENMQNIFNNYGILENRCIINNIIPETKGIIKKLNKNKVKNEKKIIFAYIGDILAHNGVHKIVHTASYLEKDSCQINFYGGGYDKYINKMKQVDKSGLCHFKGAYSLEDLNDIFAEIDVLIFPNISHNTDLTVALYAISAGITIITSDMGGVKNYIIEAENGLIYNSGSTKQLAKLMTGVILNPVIIKELSKRAKHPMTYKQYIDKQYKLYRETAVGIKN